MVLRRRKNRLFSLICILALLFSGIHVMPVQAENLDDNLIQNSNFAFLDMSAWNKAQGSASIYGATTETAVFDNIKTYGVIADRTAKYQCFAQDVTDLVDNGRKYKFSFYAMLSDDYNGAPEAQRQVTFSPYVTVDGKTHYLGSYSSEITGNSSQVLTPGVWTYFEGTFQMTFSGNIEEVVIRLLEQGSNYGSGECVLGDYYVTGVSLREIREEVLIEDVEPLCDAITDDTKEDFIVGTTMSVNDLTENGVLQLINKHFNAITPGNALKPDAIFNYSNYYCPGTVTTTLNGERLVVPKTDFSRAEKILDKVLEWNEQNPSKKIQVRGHVLLWHAQTPEWFFHEDYDASNAYVSKEVMNKRLEWYIKTVLEHFTNEDSPYKDLFYGWDVVNEAVSDSTGTYRTDTENDSESLSAATHGSNSSWWHVYGSEEFIINAFKYANKYAPADIELYYNDYSTCYSTKKGGILELLKAVKNAEGTRIDGMGMQAHYHMNTPEVSAFELAIREFAQVVDSVQITEWDLKAGSNYDGSDEAKLEEYVAQAYRYKAFYDVILKLRGEGLNITGITIWGVVDKNSWLQSSSNVGGSSDGTQLQCPLLFDDYYKVKPAYWAFVNPSKIETYTLTTPTPEVTATPSPTPEATVTPTPTPTVAPTPTSTPTPSPDRERQVKAFVERMYTVALGRASEAGGLEFWTNQLLGHGSDGAAVSAGFILSPEFRENDYSDEAYLEVLYRTFFNREMDEGGCIYWMQAMHEGKSREYILSNFVNSNEFEEICVGYGIIKGVMLEDGTTINPGISQFVERLYTTALERASERAGLEEWSVRITNGVNTPEEVAKFFFLSEEYVNKHTTNDKYVETLYLTFMDRDSESSGKAYWVAELEKGMSREAVLEGFANSKEFQEIMDRYGL